ncbi:MAG TPA: hypothetical protein PKV72_06620 [Candidatus Peribacteria bacterium]|nr:hypothetical protein [Candidatus Peribacteria bacterium]
MSYSFSENRLLGQRAESPDRGSDTGGLRGLFSGLMDRARSLFGGSTPGGRQEVRGTVDRFGRDVAAVRSGVAKDVRAALPAAVRNTPAADTAFRSTGGDDMTRMIEDFRKESASLDQQRDKIFSDSFAKLEALKKQMEQDEAEDEAPVKVAASVRPIGTPATGPIGTAGTPATGPIGVPAGSPPSGPIGAPAGTVEFPATPEAVRERFRYTTDRFGTPEAYSRFLAEQLTSDDRWNKFLQAMFEYTETSPGAPAQIINMNNLTDTDSWIPPLRFMTTYNANGRISGDCEDLAFFATHIARLQGKPAFTAGLSSHVGERQPGGNFRLKTDGGHVFTGWFEPGADGRRLLRMVTTRGVNNAAGAPVGQAGIFSALANPGETDAQLITRLFNEVASVASSVPAGVRTLDPNHVQAMHVLTSGNGFAVHGNFNLLARHGELEALLQRTPPDHAGVAGIVRQELNNDRNNLGLHASLIQFLLLANDRPAIDPAMTALLASLTANPPVNRNIVTLAALRDSLMAAGFRDPKTMDLDRIVRTWMETNVRPA